MTTDENYSVTAIPTVYKGVQMRSRLEAQCAYLLDFLGWTWEYEPFSIMLSNGISYTPDFLCQTAQDWLVVETRGYETERGAAQIDGFVSLIESGNYVEIPGKDGDCFDQYLVIGPTSVEFYNGSERTRSDIPASQRPPWKRTAPIVCGCKCGQRMLFGPVFYCGDCETRPVQCAMLSISDGKIILNRHSVEQLHA